MANDINSVTLIGRLTRDPELRQVGASGNALCKISIAVNRSYSVSGEKRERVGFFDVTMWGRLGEIANQYLRKGKQVAIKGRLEQQSWMDQEGKKRSSVGVVADHMQMLGGRSAEDEGGSGGRRQSNMHVDEPGYGPGPVEEDDDIPF